MSVFNQLDNAFRPWAEWVYYVAQYNNLDPIVTSARRSLSAQARLYAAFQAGHSKYPAAPPGKSQHNYGLAIDMVTKNNAALGQYWRSIGRSWSPGDDVHFGA